VKSEDVNIHPDNEYVKNEYIQDKHKFSHDNSRMRLAPWQMT